MINAQRRSQGRVTAIQLARGEVHRDIVHGPIAGRSATRRGPVVLIAGGDIVAYLVRHDRHLAFYVFRTAPVRHRVAIAGVSCPVDLLCTASGAHAVNKARTALRYLGRRCGTDGIARLSDLFWLRLADVLARKGRRVVSAVAGLLGREIETP